MIQRYDHVLEALQMPDVFSSEVVERARSVHGGHASCRTISNPPEHTRMRKVLNRWFSPAAVRRIEPLVISRAAELIEESLPR